MTGPLFTKFDFVSFFFPRDQVKNILCQQTKKVKKHAEQDLIIEIG